MRSTYSRLNLAQEGMRTPKYFSAKGTNPPTLIRKCFEDECMSDFWETNTCRQWLCECPLHSSLRQRERCTQLANDHQIVFNPSTYPNFINFLNQYPDLADRILPTEMTFAVSRDMGAFEWAGNNLMTVFCQPSRLLDLEMWRLLYDVLRFNASAQAYIIELERKGTTGEELSIGKYLDQHGYSESFRDNYLIVCALVCELYVFTHHFATVAYDSCYLEYTPRQVCSRLPCANVGTCPWLGPLHYPDLTTRIQIQFMHNHHLLQVTGKPKWLTLRGGRWVYARTYAPPQR